MNQPYPIQLDSRSLRDALGEFATGVAVVTARSADGVPVGVTINSFASVSLEPPLVLWSLGLSSPSRAVFETCSHYAVNILAADQVELSQRFSQSIDDRFAGLALNVGAGDTPIWRNSGLSRDLGSALLGNRRARGRLRCPGLGLR